MPSCTSQQVLFWRVERREIRFGFESAPARERQLILLLKDARRFI